MTGRGRRSSWRGNKNLVESTAAFLNRVLEGVGAVERDPHNKGALLVPKEAMYELGRQGRVVGAEHLVRE